MIALLDPRVWAAGALVLALLASHTFAWRAGSAAGRVKLAEAQREQAAQVAEQTSAALKAEQSNTTKSAIHTQATQEASDGFTTSAPVRDAIHRADLARAERLRLDAERRAATYRAMSEASAAACSDLADRHATLDRQLVEGVAVVADLRGDLDRRDAEVRLLRRQIDADRALSPAEDKR